MSFRVIPVDFSRFFCNYFSISFYSTMVRNQKKRKKSLAKSPPPANRKKIVVLENNFFTHTHIRYEACFARQLV